MANQIVPSGRTVPSIVEVVGKAATEYGLPLLHWGFIPAVILVGMLTTKPRPTVGQLFFLA